MDDAKLEYLKEQIPKYGYLSYEVDGSISPDEMADMIEQHFASFQRT